MNTKRLFSTIMMLLVTASLLLAACAPAAPATTSRELSDPVTVVQTFYDLYNANKIDEAMALTAEDYVMNDPFGTYDRAGAAIQWQSVRDAGLTFNQTNFVHTGDGRVTSCYEVLENGQSIDKGCGNVTHVRDGRIVYDGLENAEQIWIVQKYYEALNARQLDLALSFLAPDALFINPTGTYEGAEAIRESLAGLNADGITFELSNFRNTEGSVVYDYRVMQGSNLLDQGTNGLTIVHDGRIVFDGTEETNPAAAVSDPAQIAQVFYQAINEGDIEAAMQLVSEDIKCRGACYLSGKQSFQSFIQGSINMGGRVELSDLQVDGQSVTYIWTAYNADGVPVALGQETMQIQNGQITLFETQLGTSP